MFLATKLTVFSWRNETHYKAPMREIGNYYHGCFELGRGCMSDRAKIFGVSSPSGPI